MTERVVRLDLRIETDPAVDAAELATLAGQLRKQLLELDIERADHATAGSAPPDTRAGELLVAGALTVILAQSSELFTALIARVQSWISPSGGRSVKVKFDGNELELTGISRKDQHELMRFWQACIEQHTDG